MTPWLLYPVTDGWPSRSIAANNEYQQHPSTQTLFWERFIEVAGAPGLVTLNISYKLVAMPGRTFAPGCTNGETDSFLQPLLL